MLKDLHQCYLAEGLANHEKLFNRVTVSNKSINFYASFRIE